MASIEKWIEKLTSAEKTCLVQDGEFFLVSFSRHDLFEIIVFSTPERQAQNSLHFSGQNRACRRIQRSNRRDFR
jgi:hypothetical protein